MSIDSSRSSTAKIDTDNWHRTVDDAWRSTGMRRRFETEMGLEPIASSIEERREQVSTGYFAQYQGQFMLWITKQFNLQEIAPSNIKNSL